MGVGDGDLAHVVHDGRQSDLLDLDPAQPLAQRGGGEQGAGDVVDAADVLARFLAAELNGRGQRLDHAAVQRDDLFGLGQQVGLLQLHHVAQPLPRAEQFHHRLHPPQHHIGDHRLADDVHHPQGVGLLHDAAGSLSRDEKDGDLFQQAPLRQSVQHLDAVHLGHDNVQQDGAQAVLLFQNGLEPRAAVRGGGRGVIRAENRFEDRAVDRIVVHDQHHAAFGHGRRPERPVRVCRHTSSPPCSNIIAAQKIFLYYT